MKLQRHSIRSVLLAVWALSSPACGQSSPNAVPPGSTEGRQAHSQDLAVTVPHCAAIAAQNPSFGPLAAACDYALSPGNLPSFVCDESAQQFTSSSGPGTWQPLDTVTATVTFQPKKLERFSNLARDGHPIHGLSKPHGQSDLDTYFAWHFKAPAPALNVFGSELSWIFNAKDEASFQDQGQINAGPGAMKVFGFQVTKSPNHLPAIGWISPGDQGEYLGMKGLLWSDAASGHLRRLVVHYTGLEPELDVSAIAVAIDYGQVQISDLGEFLLPVDAEYIHCGRSSGCRRDTVAFANCHKFAAKSRILPAQ